MKHEWTVKQSNHKQKKNKQTGWNLMQVQPWITFNFGLNWCCSSQQTCSVWKWMSVCLLQYAFGNFAEYTADALQIFLVHAHSSLVCCGTSKGKAARWVNWQVKQLSLAALLCLSTAYNRLLVCYALATLKTDSGQFSMTKENLGMYRDILAHNVSRILHLFNNKPACWVRHFHFQ